MTLTAPEHLRGPMSRLTSHSLRMERLDWIASAYRDHSAEEIAEALGISYSRVSNILIHYRVSKDRGPDTPKRLSERHGVQIGHVGDSLSRVDADVAAHLFGVAASTNRTVADVMADLCNQAFAGKVQ